MYIASQTVFDLEVVKHIHSFRDKREVQLEEVESSRLIYETKHITMRAWHGCGGIVLSITSKSRDGTSGHSWPMMMSLPIGLLKVLLPSGGTVALRIWLFYLTTSKRAKLVLMMTTLLFFILSEFRTN